MLLVHGFSHKEGPHKEWETISRKLRGLVRLFEFNPKLEINKNMMGEDFKNIKTPFLAIYPKGQEKYRRKYMKLYDHLTNFDRLAEFVSENTED